MKRSAGRILCRTGYSILEWEFTIYDEFWDIDGSERTAYIEGDADL